MSTEVTNTEPAEQETATETINEETTDSVDSVEDSQDTKEVDKPEESEKEKEPAATDEVEALRKELEAISGKLSTIRKTADNNAGAAKAAKVENMRLRAALKAGLSEEELILINADSEEDINKQVALITKKLGSTKNGGADKYLSLAGVEEEAPAAMSSFERQLSEQLSQINKGF